MSDTFYIKTGDTSPVLQYTLSPTPATLAGATVVFNMRTQDRTSIIARGTAYVVGDVTAGVVRYVWQSGDTDTAGLFNGEFEVTFSDGSVETFPNYEYFKVRISDDLG